MKTIQSGCIYKHTNDGREFRVLLIDAIGNIAVCVRLGCASARPKQLALDELNTALKRGGLIKVTEVGAPDEMNPGLLSDAAKKRFAVVLQPALEKLLAPGYLALSEKCLWKEIKTVADEINLSAVQERQKPITASGLNAVLTKVLQAGGRMTAGIPRWHKGGVFPAVTDDHHAVARPTSQRNSLSVGQDVIRKIRASVKKHLVGDRTWVEAYDLFKDQYYTVGITRSRGKDVPVHRPDSEIPSLQQYYRHGKKALPRSERLKNQHGERAFQLNHRGKPKGQSVEGVLPGVTAELDWTISDIVGVRRGNRLSIGRFIIYVVIDKFSGQILSVHLSMHSGRFDEAARAILLCLEDKVELCAKYGLKIEKGDWDVADLFNELVTDKGEVDSFKASPIGTGLGIHVEHTPGRRPDQKGTCESFFRIVRWLLRRLRGATSGFRQRLEKDPRITAIYDFDDIYHMLLALVVKMNGRVRRRQALPEGLDVVGVLNVPKDLWAWAKESGCTRQFSLETARLQLMPCLHCSVTAEGIYLSASKVRTLNARGLENLGVIPPSDDAEDDGAKLKSTNPDRLLYALPKELNAEEWLVEGRAQAFPVEISVDTAGVDVVYLRHRRQGEAPKLYPLHLAEGQDAWKGLSWQEFCILSTQRRRNLRQYTEGEQRILSAWFNKVIGDRTSLAARKTAEARDGMTDAELKSHIALNRILEMADDAPPSASTGANAEPKPYVERIADAWRN